MNRKKTSRIDWTVIIQTGLLAAIPRLIDLIIISIG